MNGENITPGQPATPPGAPPGAPGPSHDDRERLGIVLGGALVAVGAWLLLQRSGLVPDAFWNAWRVFQNLGWGLGLVIAGAAIILFARRGGQAGLHIPAKGTRLFRSRTEKVISGVLGGVGAYFSVDPTIIRLAYSAGALIFGFWSAVIAYIIAGIIIPLEPEAGPPPFRSGTSA